jgi:hypothetical protein
MRRTTTLAMRRTTLLIAAMVAAVLLASGAAFSQSAPAGDSNSSSLSQDLCRGMPPTSAPDLPIMTRNLYLGANLDPVVEAVRTGPPEDVFDAVSDAWAMIERTNFPKRAELLADEINKDKPMLVGLQEVSLYRTGTFQDPTPAEEVKYDYLEILLGELNKRELHYEAVVETENYDAEFSGDTDTRPEPENFHPQDIRLTDRDVILARTDLPKSQLKLSNAQTANFATNASFPIGDTGQSFTLFRGWGSVDAKVEDGTFRFINTHLEPESNPVVNAIQVAQGNEILNGPAETNLPVILAGDFNSRADGPRPPGTQTYDNLIGAGFKDAWSVTHPGELGYTWGHQEDLRNTTVNFDRRIDLVLFRDGRREDGLCASGADIVGDVLLDPNASGPLWPSDHAGVVATLRVE